MTPIRGLLMKTGNTNCGVRGNNRLDSASPAERMVIGLYNLLIYFQADNQRS